MCVPSLATNLLSVYKMTDTSSPKRIVFGPDKIDISDISTGKLIAKGVVNHASKAYEFSHFFPYSVPLQDMQPVIREGKFILPKPFTYDDVSCDESDPEFKDEDQVE